MNSYNKEINFHLPGLFRHIKLYDKLIQLFIDKTYMFKDNVNIGSIYGSPTVIWNGGRLTANYLLPKKQLEFIKNLMQNYNIPVRFTFTNCLLEEQHLLDTYGNLILDIYNTGMNEIICNSELLENYIRQRFGNNYKYISSTTKRLTNIVDQNKELQKNYHLIVLDYDHNKNYEYLQSIQQKEKCELLCNPICESQCQLRFQHYQNISYSQLNFDNYSTPPCNFVKICKNFHNSSPRIRLYQILVGRIQLIKKQRDSRRKKPSNRILSLGFPRAHVWDCRCAKNG